MNPLEMDIKPSLRKKMRKEAKALQRYDANPPKCLTCKSFSPRVSKGFIQVPYCRIGHFAASADGVCDLWAGLDGAELES